MNQPTLLIVRFAHDWPQDRLRDGARHFAETFCKQIDGLRWKAFLESPGESGGVYLFEDRASAERYIAGPILDGLRNTAGVSRFSTEVHGVMEAPSLLCGLKL